MAQRERRGEGGHGQSVSQSGVGLNLGPSNRARSADG